MHDYIQLCLIVILAVNAKTLTVDITTISNNIEECNTYLLVA